MFQQTLDLKPFILKFGGGDDPQLHLKDGVEAGEDGRFASDAIDGADKIKWLFIVSKSNSLSDITSLEDAGLSITLGSAFRHINRRRAGKRKFYANEPVFVIAVKAKKILPHLRWQELQYKNRSWNNGKWQEEYGFSTTYLPHFDFSVFKPRFAVHTLMLDRDQRVMPQGGVYKIVDGIYVN